MARRDDAKTRALAASRTLNPRPEKVADPAFAPGSFFDPADLVQVKYEMVRQAETGGAPAARAAAAFGFSRQSLYTARAALREQGLAGLIPGKPGPKGGHKLTEEVVSHLEELLAADAGLQQADLAAAAGRRFGVMVVPAFGGTGAAVRRKARSAAGQASEDAPESWFPYRAPCHRCRRRTWWRAMSSCAVSRLAATPGAGVMAWACWWPRGWPVGWPRAPPCRRPRPSTAALPQR